MQDIKKIRLPVDHTKRNRTRGDYVRVLSEFWADGPDSETPPGHWFVLLNYVSDRPQLLKKWRGSGRLLESLEWDVKAYFVLGGLCTTRLLRLGV